MVRQTVVALSFALAVAGSAAAQTPEERAAARDLIAKRGDTVVTVLGTVKTRMTMGGREAPPNEENIQANATVLDERGLAVMSLTNLEPGKMMSGILSQQSAGMPGMEMSMKTETTNLRLRLADGKEVPARVVLRDEDLDLAFLRPTQPLAAPIPFLEATSARPVQLDPLITLQRLGEMTGWKVSAAFSYVMVVIDKPRTAFLGGMSPGAPVFDAAGRFVGVSVMLSRGSSGGQGMGITSGLSGMGGLDALGFMPVVLPADEIREVAKQAPAK
jgi:S1-C subfamily serine protease